MGNLVFVFIIAAIAFWLGRQTKHSPSPLNDTFANSAIQSRVSLSETDTTHIPMNFKRAFSLIFISGWIIAWSAGIVMAVGVFLSSFGSGFTTIFIGGWLLAAIAGWVFAANTIYKLATGKPVYSRGGQTY